MQQLKIEEWLNSLDTKAQDRFERTVGELVLEGGNEDEVRMVVMMDMTQPNAPLALRNFLHHIAPSHWPGDPEVWLSNRLTTVPPELTKTQGAEISRSKDAIQRMLDLGVSPEDLRQFAFLVELLKVDDIGFTLAQGSFNGNLPGWALDETWDGHPTGRPLSIWGVYARDGANAEPSGGQDESVPAGDQSVTTPVADPACEPTGCDPTKSMSGEVYAAHNPAIASAPLIGSVFWRLHDAAQAEWGLWKRIPTRNSHIEARRHAAALGDHVRELTDRLHHALGHDGNKLLRSKGFQRGGIGMDREEMEQILMLPIREIVAALSVLAAPYERRIDDDEITF